MKLAVRSMAPPAAMPPLTRYDCRGSSALAVGSKSVANKRTMKETTT